MNVLDKGFFRLARNVSLDSLHKVRVGAVVVIHGKPISASCNLDKSHPRFTTIEKCGSIHAEIKAVMQANTDVGGGTVYVYRETNDGIPALARPCNQCYKFLRAHNIKRVYYTIGEKPYWNVEKIK